MDEGGSDEGSKKCFYSLNAFYSSLIAAALVP
jgi:hypothetical protein